MKYNRNRHSVTNINYHIVFCPKYRKPFLLKNRKQLLSCFRKSCIMHRCIIKEIEIMPDHVHIFVSVLKPGLFALSKLIQHLKGWSSFQIRKKNPWMKKKYKAFWSPSYFAESIGHISEKVVKKYISDQTTNLKPTYKYCKLVKKYLKEKKINDTKNNKLSIYDFETEIQEQIIKYKLKDKFINININQIFSKHEKY